MAGWTKADIAEHIHCGTMSQRRLLALLSLLLGVVAGLLLLLHLLDWPNSVTLDWFVHTALLAILGVVVIIGAWATYDRQYAFGGVLNIIIGLIVLIYWHDVLPGVFALLGGILGVVAGES